MIEWIFLYILSLLFWLWIALWGGAERLENTLEGFLLIDMASFLETDTIKIFAWFVIFVSTILFLIGIFNPEFRF